MAGGRSSRFGSPKSRALLGGKTLLEISVNTARSFAAGVMVITQMELKMKKGTRVTVRRDLHPGQGPLGGIETALFHSRFDYTAILPCDMPRLRASVYRRLAEEAVPGRPAAARSGNGVEPLVSIWPRSALPAVQEELETGRASPAAVFYKLGGREVNMRDMEKNLDSFLFININRPADLAVLEGKNGKNRS